MARPALAWPGVYLGAIKRKQANNGVNGAAIAARAELVSMYRHRPVGCLTKSKNALLLAEFKVNCNFYGKMRRIMIYISYGYTLNCNSLGWTGPRLLYIIYLFANAILFLLSYILL